MTSVRSSKACDFWRPDALAAAAGGQWVARPPSSAPRLAGLATDSRSLTPGQVFLALKGENFDGHDFVAQAASAGASLIIVDRDLPPPSGRTPLLKVDNTLAALHRLARACRQCLARDGTKVIAVTGSSGKTSTRALIHAALSVNFRGTQSAKSFNNHIGVPLTILAARPGDDFLVAEVGTNHPGEIAPLADLLQPDAAVITNIGSAHLGHFGTRASIAREKSDLLRHVRPAGLAVLPADCDLFHVLRQAVPAGVTVTTFGAGGDVPLQGGVAQSADGVSFSVGQARFDLPLLGEHNAVNALAAVAVARWFGLADPDIARGLGAAALPDMRLQVIRFQPPGGGGRPLVVLNDAYNANPQSMSAALKTLTDFPASNAARRIAILGDMLELGDQSPALHRQTLQRASDLPAIDEIIAIGPAMSAAAAGLPRVLAVGEWRQGLAQEMAEKLCYGDVVLLKGSRAMKMERILDALRQRLG